MTKLIIKNKILLLLEIISYTLTLTLQQKPMTTHIIHEVKSLALYLLVCVSKKQTNCWLFKLRTNWLND